MEGIENVIHLASLSNDPLGSLNTKLTEQINYEATIKLAKYAKRQKVKRFIFISKRKVFTEYLKTTIKPLKRMIKILNQ